MKLTKEERKINKDILMGKYVSVPNVKQEVKRLQKIVKSQTKRKLSSLSQ